MLQCCICLSVTYLLVQLYLVMMGWTAAAFTRPYLTRTCRVCPWMNSLTVRQSRAMAEGNEFQLWHWRTFSGWSYNWHILGRKLSEVIYLWSHLEKQLAIYTRSFPVIILYVSIFHAVFVVGVDKFPAPSIFPHMSSSLRLLTLLGPTNFVAVYLLQVVYFGASGSTSGYRFSARF